MWAGKLRELWDCGVGQVNCGNSGIVVWAGKLRELWDCGVGQVN